MAPRLAEGRHPSKGRESELERAKSLRVTCSRGEDPVGTSQWAAETVIGGRMEAERGRRHGDPQPRGLQ